MMYRHYLSPSVEDLYLAIDDQVCSINEIMAILETLKECDIPANAILAATPILPEMLKDPNIQVSIRQRIQVHKNIHQLSTEYPAIALRSGMRMHTSAYGLWGYALLSSATLADAIQFALKYLRIAAPLVHNLFDLDEQGAYFEAKDVLTLESAFPTSVELWFASLKAIFEDITHTEFTLQEIHLGYPPPKHHKSYSDVFKCPVIFNASHTQFRFDSDYLSIPLPLANTLTMKECEEHCSHILENMETWNGLAKNVKIQLLQTPGYFPDIESIAEKCHISSRTLRRRLNAQGTSYKKILTNVRKHLAIQYLKDPRMGISEIAELVGFHDTANFRHAFKKWTGKTPSAYRKSLY